MQTPYQRRFRRRNEREEKKTSEKRENGLLLSRDDWKRLIDYSDKNNLGVSIAPHEDFYKRFGKDFFKIICIPVHEPDEE